MATTYQSNVYDKQTADSTAKLYPVDLGGRVRLIHGAVTVPSGVTPAVGDKVMLCRLPKGARVLPSSMIHFQSGQNASLTVDVGDAGDDDRYLAVSTVGANETTVYLTALRVNADGYVTPAETDLFVKAHAVGFAAGKNIVFDIFYVVD